MATKKGGGATASATKQKEKEQVSASNHDITVRIDKLFDDPDNKLKAVASINIGDFAVHGFKVFESKNGLFAQMPSTSYTDSKGNTKYDDVFHPLTAELRKELSGKLLESYKLELEQSQNQEQGQAQSEQAEQTMKMR